MIALRGRAAFVNLRSSLPQELWLLDRQRQTDGRNRHAYLVEAHEDPPPGYALYIAKPGLAWRARGENVIELPSQLDYVQPGDVVSVSADGTRLFVMWRRASHQNSVLLTEQCDNYCLMCSQPPKPLDDSWLLDRACDLVSLLPADTSGVIFTGGEPTLYGERFVKLLTLCNEQLPIANVHILSNGRRFADLEFARSYATVENPRMMVGIPLYGSEPSLHDYVVQAPGAFDETILGILNLAKLSQRIELRVVLHKQTAPAILEIAEFIARNLPFVEHVALMGLEMTGLARANLTAVWIDPFEYRKDLSEATLLLNRSGVRTMIYNHQLCVIEPRVWRFAVKSISDWKNEYDEACQNCGVVDRCGGFFNSAKYMSSSHIRPIGPSGEDLVAMDVPVSSPSDAACSRAASEPRAWRRRTN